MEHTFCKDDNSPESERDVMLQTGGTGQLTAGSKHMVRWAVQSMRDSLTLDVCMAITAKPRLHYSTATIRWGGAQGYLYTSRSEIRLDRWTGVWWWVHSRKKFGWGEWESFPRSSRASPDQTETSDKRTVSVDYSSSVGTLVISSPSPIVIRLPNNQVVATVTTS